MNKLYYPEQIQVKKEMWWATPMFSTIIHEYKSGSIEKSYNEEISEWVLGLSNTETSAVKSNVGGWQSETKEPDPRLNPLILKIDQVCKKLEIGITETYVPQIWINVNRKGNWNLIHQHGPFCLSGTYYVKVPKNSGDIIFSDPRPAAGVMGFVHEKIDGGDFKIIQPQEGMLLIWPSFLEHFVSPNHTDESRISISFDVQVR